jgi:hypothetical protein
VGRRWERRRRRGGAEGEHRHRSSFWRLGQQLPRMSGLGATVRTGYRKISLSARNVHVGFSGKLNN